MLPACASGDEMFSFRFCSAGSGCRNGTDAALSRRRTADLPFLCRYGIAAVGGWYCSCGGVLLYLNERDNKMFLTDYDVMFLREVQHECCRFTADSHW